MKITKVLSSAIALMLVLIISGCHPQGPDYADELDIVYTSYDDEFDFKKRQTYARPDSIVVDVEIALNGDTNLIYMKPKFSNPILAEIDRNMLEYGWTKVDIGQDPDVLLMPAGTSTTTYYTSYWYDWWYGGWYGGWYGWYYPPYYYVGSYTTGSFFMVISDPHDADNSPINRSPAAWLAACNGLLTGYSANRVTQAIDQSFEQSPYLKIN